MVLMIILWDIILNKYYNFKVDWHLVLFFNFNRNMLTVFEDCSDHAICTFGVSGATDFGLFLYSFSIGIFKFLSTLLRITSLSICKQIRLRLDLTFSPNE